MKYLKTLESTYKVSYPPRPKLLSREDLSKELLNICTSLTDAGLNFEGSYQDGYATFYIFPSDSFYWYFKWIKEDNNIGELISWDRQNLRDKEKFFEDFVNYSKLLTLYSQEIPEISDRITELSGFKEMDLNVAQIKMIFNYISDSYNGHTMLAGDASKSMYR